MHQRAPLAILPTLLISGCLQTDVSDRGPIDTAAHSSVGADSLFSWVVSGLVVLVVMVVGVLLARRQPSDPGVGSWAQVEHPGEVDSSTLGYPYRPLLAESLPGGDRPEEAR